MPKFVSELTGKVYPNNSGKRKEDEIDTEALINETNQKESVRKPSAINKKGTKEQQKNSLDLFKEELRRLQEERNEQRSKIKRSIKDASSQSPESQTSQRSSQPTAKPQIVPVALKPDPRCPTQLTLQVNLHPKDRESSMSGSFDNGDPTTTNLYLGNINPTVNENDLCDLFGKLGPLASIKIMWPRTDEERARNRNSGFVAYMSRIDAERALKTFNGKEYKGYDMKLGYQKLIEICFNPTNGIPVEYYLTLPLSYYFAGWGKAVPIPQNPVYVPPELLKLTQPPPYSGLPFNAQLDISDIERGYIVPNPYPKPLPAELEQELSSNLELQSMKEAYEEFLGVIRRAIVRVVAPRDRSVLDRIHRTIEYVIKEGPVFEAIIIARENKNPLYSFLYSNQSPEHIYYRWKLYSTLHGDDPNEWRTEEFRMFEGGSIWKPPPLNPYADGMPAELIAQSEVVPAVDKTGKYNPFSEGSQELESKDSRLKGTLGPFKREALGDLLRNLDPTKIKIGSSMMFCINHSDAASEIVDCISESLSLLETPFQRKIARFFLVSDILHNCSASVTNASYYRKGFQAKLVCIFQHLREYLINIEDRYKADKFKQKILSVLGAWKEWTLYEDEFIFSLSNILLGIKKEESQKTVEEESEGAAASEEQEDDLDGIEADDQTLERCLEAKGLSLRWYMTLELSDDEDQMDSAQRTVSETPQNHSPSSPRCSGITDNDKQIRFKTSKWETVDPNEVAGQVVTISKWESMALAEEEQSIDSSLSGSGGSDDHRDGEPEAKRINPESRESSSS